MTSADVDVVSVLAGMARELVAPERGGALMVAREAGPVRPAAWLGDTAGSRRGAWVGTIDDTVIGFGFGRVEELADGRPLGVIDELFVEPGARGIGVGEALLEALVEWFDAEGCIGVDALALPGDRATKNFFEGSGFTARLLVMHRRPG